MTNIKIAIVRIRGKINVRKEIEGTMRMLRLFNKNTCTVVPNAKAAHGMIKKVKDYVTWGEINEKTFTELLKKRGKLPGSKSLTEKYLEEKTKTTIDGFTKEYFEGKKELKDIPGLKRFFRLKPPEKGFERKGIKKTYAVGGVLGYRKDKINELIMRML